MKMNSRIALLLALAMSLGAVTPAYADERAPKPNPGVTDGERPSGDPKPGEDGQGDRGDRVKPVEIPRINVPPNLLDKLPEDLKKLIENLKSASLQFVEEQKDLAQKLRGATSDEKEAIKKLLKENKDLFLAETKTLRADIRERLKELREELKNTKPVDAGAGEAGRKP